MNPLLSRLAGLRRKTRLLEGWQGICAVLALAFGAVVAVGVLDWTVQLPSFIRSVALVGIVGGTGYVAYRYLLQPLSAPCDDLTLALRIEEKFPELNDSLASTVQFLAEPADTVGAASSSQAMRKKAVEMAVNQARQYDFGRILSYRPALLLTVALAGVVAVAAHFAYRHRPFSRIAVYRLADPFGNHTWTTVNVSNVPKRIAMGNAFRIEATLAGKIPEQAKVEIRASAEEVRPEQREVRVQRDKEHPDPRVVLPLDMTKHNKDFEFRIVANDGSFPSQPGRWHKVQVLPPPSLADLDGKQSPQIAVAPPEYTALGGQQLPPGTKMIKAWAGSGVVFRAATDRPVARVWFEYRPQNIAPAPVPAYRAASLVGQLAALSPVSALGEQFGGQTLWDRIDADLDSSGEQFAIRFTAWSPGTCILHLEDEDGLPKEYAYELQVSLDPLPVVNLRQPATDLTLLPDAEVTFRFQTSDETFGMRSIYVDYQRGTREVPIGTPGRAVLMLPKDYDKDLPQLTAPLVVAGDKAVEPIQPTQTKPVDVTALWKLNNHFNPGETVVLEVCADDFCNVYGTRLPGRSHQVRLLIVTKSELAKVIDDKLKGIQQDVTKVRKLQQEARDIVKEIENKDKVGDKDVEHIQEAEQMQKQIQEQVGTPEDGLRKDLDKLQQLLKDNKMKDSEAALRTGMIKGALDQLARQELPQIEAALSQARKKLAAEANKQKDNKQNPKTEPKPKTDKKDTLGKTAKLQQSALQNLDELARALSPWASIQEVKDELRSILDKQHEIGKELTDVKNKSEKPEASAGELRDQLKKDADAQSDLAKRAAELQNKIDEVLKQRKKEGDKENVKRLTEAKNIGENAALAQKMKEMAQDLKDTADAKAGKEPAPSNQTQQQSKKVTDALDKMLSALDGKDDVNKAKLQKNLQAQDKLAQLNKKMQELKNKLDKINKIEDMEERLQKRKDLSEKLEDLRNEAEEQARELARLQEQQASKKLDQVANDLDEAAKKAKAGQDPGGEQQQAQDELKKAKQALEQSEEELAREQLAKIADRLTGLKERQDAAVERTKDFQRKLMAKKNYTDALGKTLERDTKAQEGLARETRSLKEKIKDARVFEHIMERAAKSMDEAVQAMKDRRDAGMADRQKDLKAGERWNDEDIAAEKESHEETLRHQTQAAGRLKRLIDAVKEELAKKPPEKKENQAKNGDEGGDQQPKMRAADGIPAVAQLKALRAEQLDLNDRTEAFAKRNANANNLPDNQRRELEQLELDQRNLQELFRQMTANAEKKGDAQ